jgi:hypothetical protein
VPYQAPVSTGNSAQSALVFEVVAGQSPAAAASCLAEPLVEMRNVEEAAAATGTVNALAARLSNGGDRYLPWDRRVSVAIVMAQAGRIELSRDQARRCLAKVNEARLRSLSTGSLFALLVLGRSFGLEITCDNGRGPG